MRVGEVEGGVTERGGARGVRGEHPAAGGAQPGEGVVEGHPDDDGEVEERPGRRPDHLGVVDVDAGVGEDDRVGTGGVGAADDRPRVTEVTDVGEDDDEERAGATAAGVRTAALLEGGGERDLDSDRLSPA